MHTLHILGPLFIGGIVIIIASRLRGYLGHFYQRDIMISSSSVQRLQHRFRMRLGDTKQGAGVAFGEAMASPSF